MTWLGRLLDTLLSRGRRKAVQTFGALVALTVMGVHLKATFPEYRDGIVVLLGFALGAHVAQQATQRKETQ